MDRFADAARQQSGEQEPAIAVAEEGFGPRRIAHPCDGSPGNAVRAIAAARKPHRIDSRIVRDLDQCIGARGIGSGEMPVGQETLRVEHDLRRIIAIALGNECRHAPRDLR